jgi:hypothetical protein
LPRPQLRRMLREFVSMMRAVFRLRATEDRWSNKPAEHSHAA